MNIALQFRPIDIRLMVAYMADASNNGFPKCDHGSTWSRTMSGINDALETKFDDYNDDPLQFAHPYARMWVNIDKWYDSHKMFEMSDDEIRDIYKSALANGIDGVTGIDIMNAKRRWADNHWTRYEQQRNGRRGFAKQWGGLALMGTAACFGIVLPQP